MSLRSLVMSPRAGVESFAGARTEEVYMVSAIASQRLTGETYCWLRKHCRIDRMLSHTSEVIRVLNARWQV